VSRPPLDPPELAAELGILLGCDPATISPEGFTMTAVGGGAYVNVTLGKRISHKEAERLGEILYKARTPKAVPPSTSMPE